jgi:hypothetical protein
LDSLGFLRPIRGFSMGYERFQDKKFSDPSKPDSLPAQEDPPPLFRHRR